MNDQAPPPPPGDRPAWAPPGDGAPGPGQPPPPTPPGQPPPPGFGAPPPSGYPAPPPPGYGAPPPGYAAPPAQWAPSAPMPGQSNGLAVGSLVCGVVSLLCLGALLGIPAVVLGFLGLNKARELGGTGKGQAIAGIVLGGLAILWSLGVLLVVLAGGTTTTTSF